jgi:hypothetical protein
MTDRLRTPLRPVRTEDEQGGSSCATAGPAHDLSWPRVTVSVHQMSAQPTVQVAAGITLRSGDEDVGGSGNPSPEGGT